MNVIETVNLTKYYGKALGIKDVNLNVKEGEIFGFIGPNGAGKSTAIRLILNLIYPSSGSIKLFGKDAIRYGSELRKDIGYLPSEVFYYDKMKVKDLLEYSASFYEIDCSKRIKELSNLMELDLNRKIEDLSYGNKKKVGIVQGLIHNPKLIILDEPTGGLDPLMQQKFFNLLREENKKGNTIFFSSHILGEVQSLCDRVGIIREGSIIEVSDIKGLRENNYKKIYLRGENISETAIKIDGVSQIDKEQDYIRFLYNGDINKIVKQLSVLNLKDINIEEPTLEEIFMHYYE